MHKWLILLLTALSTLIAGGESEFFRACLEGNMDKVITLYNKEGLKLTFARDKDRNTPLHLACCSKKGGSKKEIVDFLISNGVDVNATNEHGTTPLFIAVSNENYEGVELLLKTKGLKINQKSKELTPLHIAVINEFSPMVKLLLTHPDINPNCGTQDGATPLHFAAKMGLTEIAHILIHDPRVDLNAPQHDSIYSGATPLHFAAEQAQVEIVSALLGTQKVRLNGQIDRGDFEGFTPLHLAVLNPDITQVSQTVKLLLQSGANPKVKSKLGQLPTDLTKVKMIQALLKNPNFKLNE